MAKNEQKMSLEKGDLQHQNTGLEIDFELKFTQSEVQTTYPAPHIHDEPLLSSVERLPNTHVIEIL